MTANRTHRAVHGVLATLLAAAVLACPRAASAHATGLSYLDLQVDGRVVKAALDLPPIDLMQALDLDVNHDHRVEASDIAARQEALTIWLGESLHLEGDGAPCRPERAASGLSSPALLTIRAVFRCEKAFKHLGVMASFSEGIGSGWSTFIHVQTKKGRQSGVVMAATPSASFDLEPSASPWTVANIARFLELGVMHIWTGYDHILFLIALLMLGGSLRRIIAIASSFTVAHTITLSLAALGLVHLPSRFVESAIAASIAYVALENFWHARPLPKDQEPFVLRWRWAITFFFGLVHGFGFASALGELGLARSELPVALACFNIGVEVGQIAIIVAVYPLLTFAGRRVWYRPTGVRFASVGVFGIALYWFLIRAF